MVAVDITDPFLIVDIAKNKIVRTRDLKFTTKSLRWSPDGNKIGFLSMKGELFIYNIRNDSLEKISEDPDYFDFFWTNQKKNSFYNILDKVNSLMRK